MVKRIEYDFLRGRKGIMLRRGAGRWMEREKEEARVKWNDGDGGG